MQTESENIKLYSISEASRKMGLSRNQIRQLLDEGKMGYIIPNIERKIPHLSILKYIETNTIKNINECLPNDSDSDALNCTSNSIEKFFDKLRQEIK